MTNEQELAMMQKQISELQSKVERLERIIDGFGEMLRPSPKENNARLTRWMND